jgi:hypothetical protein
MAKDFAGSVCCGLIWKRAWPASSDPTADSGEPPSPWKSQFNMLNRNPSLKMELRSIYPRSIVQPQYTDARMGTIS